MVVVPADTLPMFGMDIRAPFTKRFFLGGCALRFVLAPRVRVVRGRRRAARLENYACAGAAGHPAGRSWKHARSSAAPLPALDGHGDAARCRARVQRVQRQLTAGAEWSRTQSRT